MSDPPRLPGGETRRLDPAWLLLAWALLSLLPGCRTRPAERLLVVGGVHLVAAPAPCRLLGAIPPGAAEDLRWKDALALRADRAGEAHVVCGAEPLRLRFLEPARLSIVLGEPAIVAGERFHVRARVEDREGRELEIGQFTEIAWRSAGVLESANDPSAGEFGFCDTCFGGQGFRARGAGAGVITAGLGSVVGTLGVQARAAAPNAPPR